MSGYTRHLDLMGLAIPKAFARIAVEDDVTAVHIPAVATCTVSDNLNAVDTNT